MTCVELRDSLAENESGSKSEQQAHLKQCVACTALLEDLLVIACTAGELRAVEDPSPRVWNSLEIALRQEGLIRPQRSSRSLLPSFGSRWGIARWLVPAAAALLIAVGVYMRPHSQSPVVAQSTQVSAPAASTPDLEIAGLNDADLMQEVALQSPAMQEQYSDNLRRVNQYIQDAKDTVAADPTDEEARRSLMAAYQEKSMLFELALDRSLP